MKLDVRRDGNGMIVRREGRESDDRKGGIE